MIIGLLTHVFPVYGQYQLDLKNYRSTDDLGAKTELGIRLWNSLMRNELDTLKTLAIDLISRGSKEGHKEAVAVGKRSLGTVLIRTGDPEKGIALLKEAFRYFQNKGDIVLATETMNEIGNGYLNQGNPKEAEKYYLSSLKLGKRSPDPTSAFLAEVNLGQAYIALKDHDRAYAVLQHYKNEALRHNKFEAVANAYALLGSIEQEKGNVMLAMEFYTKSADYGKRSNSLTQQAHAHNNLAIVLFQKGETENSKAHFQKALELREKTGNARYIAESYFNLAGFYFELKDYLNAEKYYNLSLELSKRKQLRKDKMDAIEGLVELFKAKGDKDRALQLLEEFIALREDHHAQMSREERNLMGLFESINEIEGRSTLEQKELMISELESSSERLLIFLYAVGTLIVIVIALSYVYRRREDQDDRVN